MAAREASVGPVRVDLDVRETLEAMAKASDRTVAYLVRQAINEFIKRHEGFGEAKT
jgi:predicted transcriptional regulator